MAVEDPRKEYIAQKLIWAKCRDVVAGEEVVHKAGTKYLPGLSGQSTEEYNAYVARAGFYNATARTVDGLSGMVFRKPPVIQAPTSMDDIVNDITLSDVDLTEFAEELVEETLVAGRFGVLVDVPRAQDVETAAQSEALNIRPFASLYKAESIIDWRMERVNNVYTLVEVRLSEMVEERNGFDVVEIEQIRVLKLEGTYFQEFYRKNENGQFALTDTVIPMMGNSPLGYIPFVFGSPRGTQAEICKPPLLDLVNTNLSHYRTTADLEHGAHFTALPTAVITGLTEEEGEYKIGSATAWAFSNPETNAFYLEFQGQGLEALEKRAKAKEEYMAFLGAKMLSPDKKQAEAAETAQIHRQGEQSVLSSISQAVSKALTQVLQICAEWSGIQDEVSIKLNKDFMAQGLNFNMITALVGAWQSGAMSDESLHDALVRGEVLDLTFEEEQERKESSAPALGMIVDEVV